MISRIKQLQEKHAPNFGVVEGFVFLFISAILLAVFAVSIALGTFGRNIGGFSIAVVSSIGGYIAFYQIRRRDMNELPTIRPGFSNDEDGGFGIQNFQPGPALSLQVKVTCDSCSSDVLTIGPNERPTHLKQGEFYSLTNSRFGPSIPKLGEKCDCKESYEDLTFSYTYLTKTGFQQPGYVRDIDPLDDLFTREDYEPARITFSYNKIESAVEDM